MMIKLDDYRIATNASVCVVCFGKPHRRRVWKMLADDAKLGLKAGDLVVCDPASNGRETPLSRFLVVEWYKCDSGVEVDA